MLNRCIDHQSKVDNNAVYRWWWRGSVVKKREVTIASFLYLKYFFLLLLVKRRIVENVGRRLGGEEPMNRRRSGADSDESIKKRSVSCKFGRAARLPWTVNTVGAQHILVFLRFLMLHSWFFFVHLVFFVFF